jgi:hypothetical protein
MADIDTILGISAEQAEFARIITALTAERDALREALRQIDVIVRMPGRWDHDAIEIKRITDRALSKENRDE